MPKSVNRDNDDFSYNSRIIKNLVDNVNKNVTPSSPHKNINTDKNVDNSNILGYAEKKDDGKQEFCRSLVDWIENWCNEKVPSFEQFTLSLSLSLSVSPSVNRQGSDTNFKVPRKSY